MDMYIWQLVLWALMFFFGSAIVGALIAAIGSMIGTAIDRPVVVAISITVGWVVYGILVVLSLVHSIRSLIELIQYVSA